MAFQHLRLRLPQLQLQFQTLEAAYLVIKVEVVPLEILGQEVVLCFMPQIPHLHVGQH